MFNVKSYSPTKLFSRAAAPAPSPQEPRRLAPSARQKAFERQAVMDASPFTGIPRLVLAANGRGPAGLQSPSPAAASCLGSSTSSPSLPTAVPVQAGPTAPGMRQQVLAKVQARIERHNEAVREEREGAPRRVASLFVIDEETGRDLEIDAMPALNERVGQAVLQALGTGHGHAGDLSARTLAAVRAIADDEGLAPHELTADDLADALGQAMAQRRAELRARLPYDREEREAQLVERLAQVARDEFALTGERLEAVLEHAFRRAWQACDDLACDPAELAAARIEEAVSTARRASLSLEIRQAQDAQPTTEG